jgi:hypothetical protein
MGFFLLLGLLVYVALAKAVVRTIGKATQSKAAQYIAIAVFVLIPTWDIVPGYLYFNHLCESEAGVKVFKTVEVDTNYFLPNGEPDQERLKEVYLNPVKLQDFSSQFHIKISSSLVREKNTGETLGTATGFAYYGGWLSSYVFPQGPPSKCPDYLVHGTLWRQVVKPKPIHPGGEGLNGKHQ